jgi:hypothetical protein
LGSRGGNARASRRELVEGAGDGRLAPSIGVKAYSDTLVEASCGGVIAVSLKCGSPTARILATELKLRA